MSPKNGKKPVSSPKKESTETKKKDEKKEKTPTIDIQDQIAKAIKLTQEKQEKEEKLAEETSMKNEESKSKDDDL